MSSVNEIIYNDGFIDGQQHMIDLWDEVNENSMGRTEAYEEFSRRLEEIRSEIEGL